jgi:hypothetical protein
MVEVSRLYYSEAGNVVPLMCEELTRFRRARKTLPLPKTDGPAELFVLARPHDATTSCLRSSVNGIELPTLQPRPPYKYQWYEISVPASVLRPGPNTFELWADTPGMNGWSLALEDGHAHPGSFITNDEGRTWRNSRMGYLNVAQAEYVVRVRLIEGQDDAPPLMISEDPDHPRLQRIREMIPSAAFDVRSMVERVRTLASWVSTRWEYRDTTAGVVYAPWDPDTILTWGKAGDGHSGYTPIVMCVHYSVLMSLCCLAAEIPARCAAFTGAINGYNGHFTVEVWSEEFGKWIFVDPTLDAMFFRSGEPLSVAEIRRLDDLGRFVEWGPGHDFQVRNPVIASFVEDNFLKGVCFQHRSLWPRTDFLSHPECTPAGHGSTSYCETSLVWQSDDKALGFGMFPCFASLDYFDAAPKATSVRRDNRSEDLDDRVNR